MDRLRQRERRLGFHIGQRRVGGEPELGVVAVVGDVVRALLAAGALLHDLGKLDAYRLSPMPQMTVPGTVIDHVALGYARFDRLAETFGLEERLRLALGHILISHHGSKEFGSPALPATPEAMIVSSADELDFRLYCWKNAVDQLDDDSDGITDFSYSAGRRFWKWRE